MKTLPVERSVFGGSELEDLRAWTSEVQAWPAGSHMWGHYAEKTASGEAICRTENVSACHDGFRSIVDGVLNDLTDRTACEPMVAFKDKINYKQPGGAGFSPHQDLPAYPGAGSVVSVLVAIDECSETSGCLWVADEADSVLPVDDRGVVRGDVAGSLSWRPAGMTPGDALIIMGLTPHYSDANRSSSQRRVLVVSYSPAREGYGRERYYSARRSSMKEASASDGQFRISTLADFEGIEVDAPGKSPAASAEVCTHR